MPTPSQYSFNIPPIDLLKIYNKKANQDDFKPPQPALLLAVLNFSLQKAIYFDPAGSTATAIRVIPLWRIASINSTTRPCSTLRSALMTTAT